MSRPVDVQRYLDTVKAVFCDNIREKRFYRTGQRKGEVEINDWYEMWLEPFLEYAESWVKENPEGYGLGRLVEGADAHLGGRFGHPSMAFGERNEHNEWVEPKPVCYRFIRVTTPQKRNPEKGTVLATFYLVFPDAETWQPLDMRIAREFRGLPPSPYYAATCGAHVDWQRYAHSARDQYKQRPTIGLVQLPGERRRFIHLEWVGENNGSLVKVVFEGSNSFSVGAVTLREVLALFLAHGVTSVDVNDLKRAVSAFDR